ncbi:hypothetical protein TgHK011_000081 [Trichoderma gracile]|nr:hypothetical protein TgHK011_000081 [Trichoderma gracile]
MPSRLLRAEPPSCAACTSDPSAAGCRKYVRSPSYPSTLPNPGSAGLLLTSPLLDIITDPGIAQQASASRRYTDRV